MATLEERHAKLTKQIEAKKAKDTLKKEIEERRKKLAALRTKKK